MTPLVGDEPRAGFYAARLVRGGPFVPIRIFYTMTGWRAEVDGKIVTDVMRVWPMCARLPLSQHEYLAMRRRDPAINARQPVNLRHIPPVKP